ncbi:cell wall-associated NlpC family hydrolase [Nocardiopsis mwathae]|uniref:Cell wall-associated NlpC family hydrolase n=1 Tax=Nocardiopsis mwathae TaxID=1472723 RepID=A0A7W9YLY0_9ACTN|nr:C40 family peptidase [Nocardiopsis mwathae]MBB6173971.1 cell wall-associated NlpC family hydrolase [Nocardiopsis mwathae]
MGRVGKGWRSAREGAVRPATRVAATVAAVVLIAALAPAPASNAAVQGPALAAAHATGVASAAASHAMNQVGKPYRYGAAGPRSFDCSGLVQWSYRKAGKSTARTTYAQFRQGRAVSRSSLRKGDLVFFFRGPGHVGVYVGNGRMVHAPRSGRNVQVTKMSTYFDRYFVGARRIT